MIEIIYKKHKGGGAEHNAELSEPVCQCIKLPERINIGIFELQLRVCARLTDIEEQKLFQRSSGDQ